MLSFRPSHVSFAELLPEQPTSVSVVKRGASTDSFLSPGPASSFSCAAQLGPGIYADQEAGCQVSLPGTVLAWG